MNKHQILTMLTAFTLFGFILFSIYYFQEPELAWLFILVPLIFLYDGIKDGERELEKLLK